MGPLDKKSPDAANDGALVGVSLELSEHTTSKTTQQVPEHLSRYGHRIATGNDLEALKKEFHDLMVFGPEAGQHFNIDWETSDERGLFVELGMGGHIIEIILFGFRPTLRLAITHTYRMLSDATWLGYCAEVAGDLAAGRLDPDLREASGRRDTGGLMTEELKSCDKAYFAFLRELEDPRNWRGSLSRVTFIIGPVLKRV